MTLNIAADSALDLPTLRAIQLFLRLELDEWLARRLVTPVTVKIVEGRFVDEKPDGERMNPTYRILRTGEIILDGDEVDASTGWNDAPMWKPANCIDEPVPSQEYVAHRLYRRLETVLPKDTETRE